MPRSRRKKTANPFDDEEHQPSEDAPEASHKNPTQAPEYNRYRPPPPAASRPNSRSVRGTSRNPAATGGSVGGFGSVPVRDPRATTNPFQDDAPRTSSSNPNNNPTNPFQEEEARVPSALEAAARRDPPLTSTLTPTITTTDNNGYPPPIFAARTVEWPLPHHVSVAVHQRLRRGLGAASDAPLTSETDAKDPTDPSFSGWMGRAFGSNVNNTNQQPQPIPTPAPSRGDGVRVRPPKRECVVSANGWILACVECRPAEGDERNNATPLRLVSRWNVRRSGDGGGLTQRDAEGMLVPLPPPALSLTQTQEVTSGIAGLFVDPTACHLLLIAKPTSNTSSNTSTTYASAASTTNTSASGSFYLHSSARTPKRITDPTNTVDSITAVGWDTERGTEGSTKRIIVGTQQGELLEMELRAPPKLESNLNPFGEEEEIQIKVKVKVPEVEEDDAPQLLMRLDCGDSEAAVTGLHFERVLGGRMLIIAVTSGNNKRTRLHTFRGRGDTFRSIISVPPPETLDASSHGTAAHQASTSSASTSTSTYNCVELPGCIDRAEFRFCNDSFAVRTATGIYHGSIDRVGGSITGAGMMSYDVLRAAPSGGSPAENVGPTPTPTSIALTPHHFVTMSEDGEVCFVSRVSMRVVQRERVDWISTSERELSGELLTDIRRPDQVWLRQGRSLVHISSSCEDRDVWRFTLAKCLEIPSAAPSTPKPLLSAVSSASSAMLTNEEKSDDALFEHTRSLCGNAAQKAVVGLARAEYHLERGNVELAARHFAQAPSVLAPFAPTALRLCLPSLAIPDSQLNASQYPDPSQPPLSQVHTAGGGWEALSKSNAATITYLTDRLRVASAKNDSVQCTMLGAWLVELHLHEKERVAAAASNANNPGVVTMAGAGGSNTAAGIGRGGNRQPRRQQQSSSFAISTSGMGGQANGRIASLASFLATHARNIDSATTIRLLASHDAKASDCFSFASSAGDIGTSVNAALSCSPGKEGALEALRVMNESPIEQAEPYYYRFATVLLSRAPMQTAKSFLSRYQHGLQPTKLLPALMHYERRRAEYRARMGGMAAASAQQQPKHHQSNPSSLESLNTNTNVDQHEGVEVQISVKAPNKNRRGSNFLDDDQAVVKYLEGVITKAAANAANGGGGNYPSVAIYNYLISLYAGMEDEAPLFRFLTLHNQEHEQNQKKNNSSNSKLASQHSMSLDDILNPSYDASKNNRESNKSPSSPPLDMSHALRIVLKTGRHFRSAVQLYMGFGLRQQAVELALKVDPVLAREIARESVNKDEKKRLWLMIARDAALVSNQQEHAHIASGGKDVVAKVVSVLKDCGQDILSIEDVLPFLPDFAQIDQFKEEICGALTSYSEKIKELNQEMTDCDQVCDSLRMEINRLGKRDMHMAADARCCFTKKQILTSDEPFYVFPSGFVALESALKQEVVPHLTSKQKKQVDDIEQELTVLKKKLLTKDAAGSGTSTKDITNSRETQRNVDILQSKLDGLIAAECPLTGYLMVNKIDKSFPGIEEDEDQFAQ